MRGTCHRLQQTPPRAAISRPDDNVSGGTTGTLPIFILLDHVDLKPSPQPVFLPSPSPSPSPCGIAIPWLPVYRDGSAGFQPLSSKNLASSSLKTSTWSGRQHLIMSFSLSAPNPHSDKSPPGHVPVTHAHISSVTSCFQDPKGKKTHSVPSTNPAQQGTQYSLPPLRDTHS